MLRSLITCLLFCSVMSYAQDRQYKEPKKALIERQQGAAREVMDQANGLIKEGALKKILEQERANIRAIQPSKQGFDIQMPEYLKKERDDRYMANILAAGESISHKAAAITTKHPIVLISLSMPESQIKALIAEAHTIGAAIAVRGLVNDDFKETLITLRQLAGDLNVGVMIDPTLFKRFDVRVVPTFILPLESLQQCTNQGCSVPEHVKASGSATLQYFLDLVGRIGTDREKTEAAFWLAKYED